MGHGPPSGIPIDPVETAVCDLRVTVSSDTQTALGRRRHEKDSPYSHMI